VVVGIIAGAIGISFSFILLFFSLGIDCVVCPSSGLEIVRVVAICLF
jgi:hypothetical protein